MEDRFTPGLIAGTIGSFFLEIYFLAFKFLGIINRTYSDYGEVLIMSKPHRGVLAFIIGMIFEFIIGGMLGVIFSYLIKFTTRKFYLLKAVCIAVTSWLFLLVPGTFYRLKLFEKVPPKESFLMLIGSILWSVIMAIVFKKITNGFTKFYTEKET